MASSENFDGVLARKRDLLSPKLRDAAEFVAANPVEVATRSLRSVAAASGLAPATFSRLARALGCDSYEELREMAREKVGRSISTFSRKVERLQAETRAGNQPPFLLRQSAACIANIRALSDCIDPQQLERVVSRMHRARSVLLVGGLGSVGIMEYMGYLAAYFTGNWQVALRPGSSLGAMLSDFGPRDVLFVVTKPPFARTSVKAAEMAARQGAFVVVVTDNRACPVLGHADAAFVIPTESPQFFSSYAATLVLVETIIGMLVARAGSAARERIGKVENRNRLLQEI